MPVGDLLQFGEVGSRGQLDVGVKVKVIFSREPRRFFVRHRHAAVAHERFDFRPLYLKALLDQRLRQAESDYVYFRESADMVRRAHGARLGTRATARGDGRHVAECRFHFSLFT